MSGGTFHASRLLDILLPSGGYVCTFEAFADFGGTQQADDRLSVACFLYEKGASQELHATWAARLDQALAFLPPKDRVFHMAPFMAKDEPFDSLHVSEGEWLSLRRDLIQSATAKLEFAVVSHLSISEFDRVNPPGSHWRNATGGPLAMSGIWALDAVSEHLQRKGVPGDVAYFFEAGDPGYLELDCKLQEVAASSYYSKKYRYAGHSFIPKTKHHALGAADMLAWEYRTALGSYLEDPSKHQNSLFFQQLFNAPIAALHFSEHNLKMRSLSVAIQRAGHWAQEREDRAGL